jgi:hypothetical protein
MTAYLEQTTLLGSPQRIRRWEAVCGDILTAVQGGARASRLGLDRTISPV